VTGLTAAGRIIASEIETSGPMQFSRFMCLALYHPDHGYYRRRDPFGRRGDFYTAEQLQPVFGRLMRRVVDGLADELQCPADTITVVELGAGRGEMAEAFARYRYIPVDISYGEMPARFTGIVFLNEFFDALPVDVVVSRSGQILERRVGYEAGRFVWADGPPATEDAVSRWAHLEEGAIREVQTHRVRWLERISTALEKGFILTIDYGYADEELARFPEGSLMSYRRHQALGEVLTDPGERDITAHVSFSDLQRAGAAAGLETIQFEPLRATLLRAGEGDEFAEALKGETEMERLRHGLQLKTLLFGMGETFRCLLQRKRQ
jgi:SAM-dependent MidA family methyltransferase